MADVHYKLNTQQTTPKYSKLVVKDRSMEFVAKKNFKKMSKVTRKIELNNFMRRVLQ